MGCVKHPAPWSQVNIHGRGDLCSPTRLSAETSEEVRNGQLQFTESANEPQCSLVDWCSKKQLTVALSTTEVEYRVFTEATRDIVHLRRLLTELESCKETSTPLKSNNQSCIKLVHNPVLHVQRKHIKLQHHYIWKKKHLLEA